METLTQTHMTVDLDELDADMQSRVEQVRESGSPVFIMEAGAPAALLVDAETYSRQQFRLLLMDRIARARRDYTDGRFCSEQQVDLLIDQWAQEDG